MLCAAMADSPMKEAVGCKRSRESVSSDDMTSDVMSLAEEEGPEQTSFNLSQAFTKDTVLNLHTNSLSLAEY